MANEFIIKGKLIADTMSIKPIAGATTTIASDIVYDLTTNKFKFRDNLGEKILNLDTMATAATDANTVSTLVKRDSSGNFSATTITASLIGAASLNILSSTKGVADGVAELDGSGKVPASQLPSYVDDVLEYANLAALPVTGETGKIYVTLDTNTCHRWTGSIYVEISSGGVTDAIVDGVTTVAPSQNAVFDALAGKVATNALIIGATKTKITYDTKGLVTAGADATTADIADSSDKRYITDAQQTVLGNTSGTNTGDQTSVSGNSGSTDALKSATTTIAVNGAAAPSVGQVLTATSDSAASWQTPAAAGANTTLSNLGSTAINANLLPALASDNLLDLGAVNKTFKDIYVSGMNLVDASVSIAARTTYKHSVLANTGTNEVHNYSSSLIMGAQIRYVTLSDAGESRSGTLYIANKTTSASISDVGVETGDTEVTFTATVSGGAVRINAVNANASDATIRMEIITMAM